MKKLFTLALLLFTLSMAQAATYYFSAVSGNDSYTATQAKNSSTPWKSITKLNSIFSTLLPGDVVLFKRGETFYGSITITKSGTSTAPITIGAYGTGANPIITGFQTITNWVSVGGGIWKATNSAFGAKMNVVTLNNKIMPMGRYPNVDQPNKGYLTVTSHVNNTSITSTQLTSTNSFTGGEVVIRKNFWTLDRCAITAHSGGTITYTGGTSWYSPQDGFGFFVQNHIKTLDQLGEWSYSPSTKTVHMFFGSSSPSSYTVKMAAITSLVTASSDFYVNITGLSFVGADNGILLVAGANINVDACQFNHLVNGVSTYPNVTDKMKISNSVFSSLLDHGILLTTTGSIVENNTMTNIGGFAGMGSNGDGGLKGIAITGASNNIRYNSLDSIGYTAIRFEGGNNNVIQNNFIRNFCFVKDDGAGIYTYKGTGNTTVYTGQKIIGNIILNAIGSPEGVKNPEYYQAAHGIYIDDNSSNVEITGNTAANCFGTGLFIHNARNLVIRSNTFYNNQTNQVIASYDRSSLPTISGLTYRRNILVSKFPTQKVVMYQSILDNLGSFGSFDSNYYCRPLNNSMVVSGSEPSRKENHDVPVWYSRFKLDPNSKQSPITYPAYKTNKLLSSNKFVNGAFSSSTSGVSAWSSSSNVIASWNSSGKLDGGSLKISYSSVTSKASTIILALTIGQLTAGKKYIMKCSSIGSKANGTVGAYLRLGASPYTSVSPIQFAYTSTSRKEHEFMFMPTVSTSAASLAIQLNDLDGTTYLDNIQLYEADVTPTDPDDYILFAYNNTKASKTISLSSGYRDVTNKIYSSSVTLAPYTSIVLLKDVTFQVLGAANLNFNGANESTAIKLNWDTEAEVNTNHYQLEKSTDGKNFKVLTNVTATNKPEYDFIDAQPIVGKNFYRLQQIATGGEATLSKSIVVNYNKSMKLDIYPNPVVNSLTFSMDRVVNTNALITVQTITGVTVMSQQATVSGGYATIPVSQLKPGTYMVTVNASGQTITKKIVKQ